MEVKSEMSMENYESVLADLQARRDQIDAAIEAIRLIMGAGAGSDVSTSGGGGSQRAIAPHNVPAGAFHRLSIVDATKKYLDMVKSKQPTPQILKALEQGGLPPTKYNTLYAVLRRRQSQVGDIVKMGDEWGLTEWYPNNPNIKRQAAEGKGAPKKKKKRAKPGKKTPGAPAAITNPTAPEAKAPPEAEDKSSDSMTLGDATERILLVQGKAMHINAIRSALAAYGKYPTRDTVAKNLPRDAQNRFKRTGPGTFDLTQRDGKRAEGY